MSVSTETVPGGRIVKQNVFARYSATLAMPAGIVVLLIIGTVLSDRFLSVGNLTNVLINMSIVGVVVVGMTFVFVSRGMADLSVPATVAAGGILVLLLDDVIGTWPAALVGVLVASLAGVVNGLLIGYAGLNPVITTLASGIIVLGIAQAFVGGVIVYGQDPAVKDFLTGRFFGVVPVIVLVFLVVALLGHLALSRSVFGRWTYAVGSNPHATEASAVPIRLVKAGAFVLTATLAGFSGVLLGISLQAARPEIGTGYEFDAITAVVVGGVSLLGGSGSIPRAIGGLLFVTLLNNVLILQGVPSEPQGMVKGALIAVAVALDVYLRRRGGRE